MKRLLLILIVVSILITGCAGEVKTPYTKPVADVTEPSVKQTELPGEEIPEREVKPAATTKGPALSSEVKNIMAKADSVESAEYSLAVFIEGEPGYYANVHLKGNKMRHVVEWGSKTFAKGTRYDTIYFDLGGKKVEAYCEEENCEDRNAVINTDYGKFETDTPFSLLEDIDYGTKIGTAMLSGMETVTVSYENAQGNEVRVWLWEYKGLPLKYELRDDKTLLKKIEFKQMVINDVDDEDLVHPTLENED